MKARPTQPRSAPTRPTRPSFAASWIALAGLLIAALGGACRDRSEGVYVRGVFDRDGEPARMEGYLVDGKRHGRWIVYLYGPNSLQPEADYNFTIEEYYRRGVRHGPSLSYDDGKPMLDRYFRNGKRHGRTRVFHESGTLLELGWTDSYFRTGIWCSWYEDGRLREIWGYGDDVDHARIKRMTDCPHLRGDGRRHLDWNDRDYDFPHERKRRKIIRRYMPR